MAPESWHIVKLSVVHNVHNKKVIFALAKSQISSQKVISKGIWPS